MPVAFLDHLILGVNDLATGIDFVERHTGVRAAFGGVHPGRGTQNALLSLGHRCYLEILAPDPQQSTLTWFRQLPSLREPRLVGWMAHMDDIDSLAERLRASSMLFDGPNQSSRVRPDGRTLRWKLLRLTDNPQNLLPIFIEWNSDSPHPAEDTPSGLHLIRFEVASPKPEELNILAGDMGLEIAVVRGGESQLRARIAGPTGELDLPS